MVLSNATRIKTYQEKIDRLLLAYGTFESLKEAARTYSGGLPNHKKELRSYKYILFLFNQLNHNIQVNNLL